ncbi:MAG: hypothetical protein WA152_02615 [Microgenomates group bacterium]
MKLLNQNSKTSKNNFVYFLILFLSFLTFIFLNREKLFQKFNPEVVDKYLRSQDILDKKNIIKDRIFVSDEEIYIASGYLYTNGSGPTEYNFQHPPFIKYLFGISARYLNLPLLPNVFFAGLLLLEVYLMGKLVFKSELIGLLSSLLLLFDPVFKEVTIYALLDLGQMVFILGFILTTFFWKKHWIGQGVLLGLAIASKFYSPVVIFLGIIYMYKILTKQFEFKKEVLMLVVVLITFALTYTIAFVKGDFNFFFYQAKIIKFMLDHNQAIEWGGVIKMFFGGYLLWPILFFVNMYLLFKTKFSDPVFIFSMIPIIYFCVLCFQLPFTRYFILILPFLYLSSGNFLVNKIARSCHVAVGKINGVR